VVSTGPSRTAATQASPLGQHTQEVCCPFRLHRSYSQDREGQIHKVFIQGVSRDPDSASSAWSMAHYSFTALLQPSPKAQQLYPLSCFDTHGFLVCEHSRETGTERMRATQLDQVNQVWRVLESSAYNLPRPLETPIVRYSRGPLHPGKETTACFHLGLWRGGEKETFSLPGRSKKGDKLWLK